MLIRVYDWPLLAALGNLGPVSVSMERDCREWLLLPPCEHLLKLSTEVDFLGPGETSRFGGLGTRMDPLWALPEIKYMISTTFDTVFTKKAISLASRYPVTNLSFEPCRAISDLFCTLTLHLSVFIKLQFYVILKSIWKGTTFRTLLNVVEYTVPFSVKSITCVLSCPCTAGQKTC